MSETMLERAMQRVWQLRQANAHKWGVMPLGPLSDEPQGLRDDLAAEVRAVIETLMSPTQDVVDAGNEFINWGGNGFHQVWEAALRQVLAGGDDEA